MIAEKRVEIAVKSKWFNYFKAARPPGVKFASWVSIALRSEGQSREAVCHLSTR